MTKHHYQVTELFEVANAVQLRDNSDDTDAEWLAQALLTVNMQSTFDAYLGACVAKYSNSALGGMKSCR